jgi:hypothetical protein
VKPVPAAFLALVLATGCGGPSKESGPAAEKRLEEEELRRARASGDAGKADAAARAAEIRRRAREAETGEVSSSRDLEERGRIAVLRDSDPAEADRRLVEYHMRRCRDGNAAACEEGARNLAAQGRYREAKEALRAAADRLEPGSFRGDARARQNLEAIRRLEAELDRQYGPGSFSWMEMGPTPTPSGASPGIGLGSAPLPR